ncbi:MAG: hypothetical protein LWX07_04225 [Bacteroidetes bacterium]|nr:hypothetical protein [Bacteroidota bacterium]
MKTLMTAIIVFVTFANCFSQPATTQDIIINPFWDFYAENRLSAINAGKGYTGVASINDISGASLNPASIVLLEKMQVTGSYDFKSRISNWLNMDQNDVKQNHPEMSVGIGYKFGNNLFTGITYTNDYSFKIEMSPIHYFNQYGQPMGSYVPYEKYTTHTLSIPVAFRTRKFRAGVSLSAVNYNGFNNLNSEPRLGEGNNTVSFWKFVPTLGVQVTPFEEFSFGATYSPPYQQRVRWSNSTVPEEQIAPVYYPAKVNVGTELRLLNKKLLIDLDYRFANTSRTYMFRDRHDLNFGVQYELEPELTVRGGAFTLLDYRTNDNGANISDPIGSYNQYFLTLGATYKYRALSVSLSYISSTVFTKPDVSTSRIAASLTWDICSCLLYGN